MQQNKAFAAPQADLDVFATETETYRLSWSVSFAIVAVGTIAGLVWAGIEHNGLDLAVGMLALLFTLPLALGLSVTLRLLIFARVGPIGITALDSWSILREASWVLIRNVRPISFLGMKYLRIYRQGSRFAIWMPVQVSDSERMARHIHAVAPDGNPVLAELSAARER